jgi:rubrerythrin
MESAADRVVQTLKKAIQAEVEGEHFYRMAARSTDDPKGREVFERLAQDEVEHARFLRAQHEAIRKTGKVDATTTLGDPSRLEGPHPIFSEKLRARVKDAHFEMTALSIGAQLELSAIEFYKAEAEQTGDPEVAAFLRSLAKWESKHYQALVDQQEALKDEYWTDSRFSPF